MPVEPNHKIDELLRKYAQKRREQAGPPMQMPPDTRALLHADIERTFHHPGAAPEAPNEDGFALASFWRRMLIGGAGVALVLVAAGIWLKVQDAEDAKLASARESNLLLFAEGARPGALPPGGIGGGGFAGGGNLDTLVGVRGFGAERLKERDQSAQLGEPAAKGVPQTERVEVAISGPSTVTRGEFEEMVSNAPRWQFGLPPQARGRAATDAKVAVAAEALGRSPAPEAPAPDLYDNSADAPTLSLQAVRPDTPLQLARDSTEGLVEKYAGLQREEKLEVKQEEMRQLASRPAAPVPAQLPAKPATAVAPATQAYANNIYFQQIDPQRRYRRNLNSPPIPRVLPTFEVQQTGTNLRIVDWDKSVYEGAIQFAPAESAPAGGQAAQSFQFQAAGTNRTLNQLVVFTGNFETPIGTANTDLTGAETFTTVKTTADQRAPQPAVLADGAAGSFSNSNLLPRAKIQGNAIVGGNNLRIEAYEFSP